MPQKKTVAIFRTNLVTVGIGQGQIKTFPWLYNKTDFNRKGETLSQSSYSSEGLLSEKMAWEYDDQGRITRQIYFTEPGEPSEIITYERNEKGQVVQDIKKYIDESLDTTQYLYDGNDRLIEKITKDDEGVVDMHEKFTWNEKVLLKHEITDTEENIISLDEFVYDKKGNIIEHQQINEETGDNQKIVSVWDEAGHKISEEIYNEDDELLETTSFEHDETGRVVSASYQSPGKISTTRYVYDASGNLLDQEETDENGNQLLWVQHEYDSQNNRTATTVFINGGTPYNSQHYELTYAYEWFEEE